MIYRVNEFVTELHHDISRKVSCRKMQGILFVVTIKVEVKGKSI